MWEQEKVLSSLSLSEDMNDIIKIIISLNHDIIKIIKWFGCINWWSHWNSKRWNKKQEVWYLGALLEPLAASLPQPVTSSVVKKISAEEK